MQAWEEDRIKARGDGVKFSLIFPDFEDYFETLRKLAGRRARKRKKAAKKFRREWIGAFMDGHELRKKMWKRLNARNESRSEDRGRIAAERARL